jgi:nucleotide-binding universal stress UspA family protein
MNSFRKILVATDGSEVSLKAARMAVALAARHGAELLVVHVGARALGATLRLRPLFSTPSCRPAT